MKYKFVSDNPVFIVEGKDKFIVEMQKLGHEYNGEHVSWATRVELQRQPMFKGLYGPMYDEFKGEPCIRYETPEMNDILSR